MRASGAAIGATLHKRIDARRWQAFVRNAKRLREGDVITEAGQSAVTSLGDLNDRIDDARESGRRSLLLLVRRGGDPRFVALGLEED